MSGTAARRSGAAFSATLVVGSAWRLAYHGMWASIALDPSGRLVEGEKVEITPSTTHVVVLSAERVRDRYVPCAAFGTGAPLAVWVPFIAIDAELPADPGDVAQAMALLAGLRSA